MAFRKNMAVRARQGRVFQDTFAAGTLQIRTGPQPSGGADAAETGVLLCTINLPSPCFVSYAGEATLTGVWSSVAAASGIAGWARLSRFVSPNTFNIDVSIGASGSGADMIIDNVNIASGATVTVISFSIIEQGG